MNDDHKKASGSTPPITIAPRDALRFLKAIESTFLSLVLEHPDALVTDESNVMDFLSDADISLAKTRGSKPGFYVFRRAVPFRLESIPNESLAERFARMRKHVVEYIEVEEEGVDHKGLIISRARHYFGVDITSVIDENFSKLFLFIAREMPSTTRTDLEPGGKTYALIKKQHVSNTGDPDID